MKTENFDILMRGKNWSRYVLLYVKRWNVSTLKKIDYCFSFQLRLSSFAQVWCLAASCDAKPSNTKHNDIIITRSSMNVLVVMSIEEKQEHFWSHHSNQHLVRLWSLWWKNYRQDGDEKRWMSFWPRLKLVDLESFDSKFSSK